MPDALAAALVALAIACVQLLTVELRIRRAQRERQALEHDMRDVKRRVGADRRLADHAGSDAEHTGN